MIAACNAAPTRSVCEYVSVGVCEVKSACRGRTACRAETGRRLAFGIRMRHIVALLQASGESNIVGQYPDKNPSPVKQ